MNEYKKILFCVGLMLTFAVVFGFMVRGALASKAQGLATQTDSTQVTVATPATPTDSGFDEHVYMTSQSVPGGALQISQLLLSIRNILLMFFGFWFLTWCFARMKVILKLFYGGKK